MGDDGFTASELRQRYERGGSVRDSDLSAAQLRARYAIPGNTFKEEQSQMNPALIVGILVVLAVLAGAAYMMTHYVVAFTFAAFGFRNEGPDCLEAHILQLKMTKGNDKFHKTVVFAEDMTDTMLERVIATAKDAFQLQVTSGKTFSTIAEYVRRNMEKEYGRGWNCIVGTSFGSYVTHEIKTYVYFSVAAGVSVLVWRT